MEALTFTNTLHRKLEGATSFGENIPPILWIPASDTPETNGSSNWAVGVDRLCTLHRKGIPHFCLLLSIAEKELNFNTFT
jgi:hypothetical protein